MPRMGRIFKKRMPFKKVSKSINSNIASTSGQGSTLSNVCEINESASKKKIQHLQDEYKKYSGTTKTGNEIIDISLLNKVIAEFTLCKKCGKGSVSIDVNKKNGLATEFIISCDSCQNNSLFFNSSILETNGAKQVFDINMRLVYALRTIGKGRAAGRTFCAVMNLPSPPVRFNIYETKLQKAAELICNDSFKNAIEEAVEKNDGSRDIGIALDGSWQRRGFLSQNGVITATSIDTGKAIDVCILSKHCRCPQKYKNIHNENCISNYSGTSGGMEVEGVKNIFFQSIEKYNVKYTQYLGDGDSKGFQSIAECKPYGETVIIKKLECVGHVQKRMGTRLRNIKSKLGKRKLSDAKTIGGKNRLTDSSILSIQKYYGLAIRRNPGNWEAMRRDIWAEYFHLLSSNNEPQHGLCPFGQDSWCKYRTAEAAGIEYDHDKHFHLPAAVMTAVKPVFQDLSNPQLLKKCIHGRTQNPNESLNSVIWLRVPKTVFVSLETLKFGVYEAISSFNSGNIAKCSILDSVGITPGINCVETLRKIDQERISSGNRKLMAYEIKARQKREKRKRQLEESFYNAEDADCPAYGAGLH